MLSIYLFIYLFVYFLFISNFFIHSFIHSVVQSLSHSLTQKRYFCFYSSILFYFILFYFILFCFTLLYFILFYFIFSFLSVFQLSIFANRRSEAGARPFAFFFRKQQQAGTVVAWYIFPHGDRYFPLPREVHQAKLYIVWSLSSTCFFHV